MQIDELEASKSLSALRFTEENQLSLIEDGSKVFIWS